MRRWPLVLLIVEFEFTEVAVRVGFRSAVPDRIGTREEALDEVEVDPMLGDVTTG